MSPDIDTQLRNVIEGRSAEGWPGYGPMSFPRGPAAHAMLRRHAIQFLMACAQLDDRTRTVFIRKLAGFISRNCHTNLHARLEAGTNWFAANPDAVCSPMSFSAAVRRIQQELQTSAANRTRFAREHVRAAMNEPEPPCPVLLADGHYALRQLVHPMHLLRAGHYANNCLALRVGHERLPNPDYWEKIANGEASLFTIGEGTALYAIFLIRMGAFREWSFHRPPPALSAFLPKCLDVLQTRFGPIRDERDWILVDGEPVFLKRSSAVRTGGARHIIAARRA